MPYNLGAVGIGHWFNRLYVGLKESNEFRLAKIAGKSDVESKLSKLEEFGLTMDDYYQVKPGDLLPERFYQELDVVHLSNPNEYHAQQTIDSLRRGKVTVTEKTWGVDMQEFDMVAKFIKENRLEKKAYLHLHYLHKLPVINLEAQLKSYTKRYGKITKVVGTFFEQETEEDHRRKGWLFSQKSGGLFMDIGIHLCEVIVAGARAKEVELEDTTLFAVKPDYDNENPTGVEAVVTISGKYFKKGAKGFLRVSKGTPTRTVATRFYFENEAHLDLMFLHSDEEYSSPARGSWKFYSKGALLESGEPKGPNNSELFVNEILEMCKGRKAGLSVDDAVTLFEPQWRYQEMARDKSLERERTEIESFIAKGTLLE